MEKMMQVTSQLLCNTFSPFSLSGDWLCDFLTFEPPSSVKQASSYGELPQCGRICVFVGVQSTILWYCTYIIYNLPIFLLLTLLTLFGSSPAHYQLPRDYHVLIEILATAWEKKKKEKEKGVKTKNGQTDIWQTDGLLPFPYNLSWKGRRQLSGLVCEKRIKQMLVHSPFNSSYPSVPTRYCHLLSAGILVAVVKPWNLP